MPLKESAKKTVSQNLMEEAPLFAGLEGCVVQQIEKTIVTKTPKKIVVKQNKKATSRRNVSDDGTESQGSAIPKRNSKPRQAKPLAIDSNAILLSIREMCLLLKISRATLVRMDNAGKIPGRMKLGGSVRFHHATVVAWLESMISSPTPF